jgi:hypothetical protein
MHYVARFPRRPRNTNNAPPCGSSCSVQLNPCRQPVKAFPHVSDAACQIDADSAGNADHDSADKTRRNADHDSADKTRRNATSSTAGQAQLHPRGQLDLDHPGGRPIGFG